MWMLPSAYAGSDEDPWGLPVLWLLLQATEVGHKPQGWPCRTLAPRCLLLPTQQSWGACLSSPVPSWACSEEQDGCREGPRFLSLFLAMCRERRITTLTFLTFSEYYLTVLFHIRIFILLSAEAFLGLFFFKAGNPKQWEEYTIM